MNHDDSFSDVSRITNSISKERQGSKIMMKQPEMLGVKIQSPEHLEDLIRRECPGVLKMRGIKKLWHEAVANVQLYHRLRGKAYLDYGELPRLASEYNIKRQTIGIWVAKAKTARLFEQSLISSLEAEKDIKQISVRNKGLITEQGFHGRMGTYYLAKDEINSGFYRREDNLARRYFRFIELYRNSGVFADICRRANIPESTARGILEGRQPRLVRIASQIPGEIPQKGHLWLPLRFKDGKYPEDFIEVPMRIGSYQEVLTVLQKLQPVDNEYMRGLNARYGRRSIEEEFMYLLGAYISDGGIFNKTTHAKSIGIRLSKTYSWSLDFGEGVCQALGACGIYAHRNKDSPPRTTHKKTKHGVETIHQNGKYNWSSENSPLIHWIHRSCLGYEENIPKREQQVNAVWILQSPFSMRRAILQGLGDGDGSASVKGNYICISSKSNKKFIQKLVESFGVESRLTKKDVFTKGSEEAKRAALIPPFRYANSRSNAAERMVRRLDSRRSIRANPLKPNEIDFIISLKQKGLSDWDTSEAFFDKFGTAIDKRMIRTLFRRHLKRE